MSNLPFLHWLNDTIACVLGLILNLLLILAIVKTANGKFQGFHNLVFVGAVYDVLFSVFEWVSLHQLLIKNGVMYIMPHGIERFFYDYVGSMFMIPHCFVGMHGLWILPAQYHYRYCIIRKPSAPLKILLRNCFLTSMAALVMACVAEVGVRQAMTLGYDHYLSQIDDIWFDSSNNSYFGYAMDFTDVETLTFFYVSFGITTICFTISIIYAYKAWRHVKKNSGEISKRTAKLQQQFTKSLVAQTVNAAIFSALPISIMCLSMQFKLNYQYSGLWVMSLISWLAAANAILAIVIIKAYRRYFMKLFGLNKINITFTISVKEPVNTTTRYTTSAISSSQNDFIRN